jgi:hypothetical protein
METKGKQEIRPLEVKLTREEVEQRAKELARTIKEHDRVDEERKAAAASAKVKIDELNAQVRKLGRAVELGTEFQDVACEWFADQRRMVMNLVRLDTHEVVSTRSMTSEERQLEFPVGAN